MWSVSKEGDVEKVRSLLARDFSIHESYADLVDRKRDAFLLTALNGRLGVLEALFECGCDGSERDLNGNMALHRMSYDPEIKPKPVIESLVLLQEHGMPLEARDLDEATALLSSAYHGKISIAECLLDHGADIHSADNAGYIALHCAAQEGHLEMLALLISKGAPLETRTKGSLLTPLYVSCFATNGSGESAKLLLQAGADKEATSDNLSCRPLHIATVQGNLEIVNELLAFGVEIDATSDGDANALHWAKRGGHWRIIEALLSKGANPTLRCNHVTRFFNAITHVRMPIYLQKIRRSVGNCWKMVRKLGERNKDEEKPEQGKFGSQDAQLEQDACRIPRLNMQHAWI